MSQQEQCPTDQVSLVKDPHGDKYVCFTCGKFFVKAEEFPPFFLDRK